MALLVALPEATKQLVTSGIAPVQLDGLWRSIRARTCSRGGACPCSASKWASSVSARWPALSLEKGFLQRGQRSPKASMTHQSRRSTTRGTEDALICRDARGAGAGYPRRDRRGGNRARVRGHLASTTTRFLAEGGSQGS